MALPRSWGAAGADFPPPSSGSSSSQRGVLLPSLAMSALLAELARGRVPRPKTPPAFASPHRPSLEAGQSSAFSQTPALVMFSPAGRGFLPPAAVPLPSSRSSSAQIAG